MVKCINCQNEVIENNLCEECCKKVFISQYPILKSMQNELKILLEKFDMNRESYGKKDLIKLIDDMAMIVWLQSKPPKSVKETQYDKR